MQVTKVLVSTQHRSDISRQRIAEYVRDRLAPRALGDWLNGDIQFATNPTGNFVNGGLTSESRRESSIDQISHFSRKSVSSGWPSSPGDQLPVETETGAMPADDGLRSDDNQRILPFGPESAGRRPKGTCRGHLVSVSDVGAWISFSDSNSRCSSLRYSQQLTKRKDRKS